MIIVNATTKLQSLMTSKGNLIQIQPGGVSIQFIADKSLVLGAIKLGSPNEIGIVVGGSYELEIVKDILAAVPYIYTDLNEAKSKLLDPNIDYTLKRQGSNEMILRQDVLNKQSEINELKNTIKSLESELNTLKSDNSLSKLNEIISEKTKQTDSLDKRIKELETQLKTANENESKLRLELNSKTTECSQYFTKLDAARKDLANANAQAMQYKSELDKLPKEADIIKLQKSLQESYDQLKVKDSEINELQDLLKRYPSLEDIEKNQKELESLRINSVDKESYEKLKSALAEASTTIDSMKAEFNAACEKFGISRDENGELVKL